MPCQNRFPIFRNKNYLLLHRVMIKKRVSSNVAPIPLYTELVALRGACYSRRSGRHRVSANHANFLTAPRLLRPPLVKIIFSVPLFRRFSIQLSDRIFRTIWAITLPARYDHVLFAADNAMVDAAKSTIRAIFTISRSNLFLTIFPAAWAVPSTRSAVKSCATLAARPRTNCGCFTCGNAVIAQSLFIFCGVEQLTAFYAFF